ncbi:MAG: hypothetical protein WHX52_12610 [Anaerolineae bacterium]
MSKIVIVPAPSRVVPGEGTFVLMPVWTPAEGRDYADFLARLAVHLRRLDGLNVHYHPLE